MAMPRPPIHASAMATVKVNSATGRIVVAFAYDPRLVSAVRSVAGRRWDPVARVWTLPRTGEALNVLLVRLGAIDDLDVEMAPDLAHLVDQPYRAAEHGGDADIPNQVGLTLKLVSERMRLRGYSPRTRKNYLGYIPRFLQATGRSISEVQPRTCRPTCSGLMPTVYPPRTAGRRSVHSGFYSR